MPSLPIVRGRPGAGFLAHVLVSKYADHLPLYRQSEIYAREGVELDRATMANWVGKAVSPFSTRSSATSAAAPSPSGSKRARLGRPR